MKTANKVLKIFLFVALFSFAVQFSLAPMPFARAANLLDQQEGFGSSGEINKTFGVSGEPRDIRVIVAQIIRVLLGLLGIIFLALLIFAGYNWMTAAGDEEKVKKSKEQIASAVIGLLIILAAYSITKFVLDCVLRATDSSSDVWYCSGIFE